MNRRQKQKILNVITSVVMFLTVGILLSVVYTKYLEAQAKELLETELTFPSASEEAREMLAAAIAEEEEAQEPEENLPDDWNLILVNYSHTIPEDFEVELKSIGNGHQVDARIYDDFQAMLKAARKDGAYIYVISSYRDMDKQIDLHSNKIEEYIREGYAYAEAKRLAAQVVAVPGTSEHHLGLALDLVSSEYRGLDERQETTKGFKWLEENCAEYGFILRYPNGKTDITGIIYEPWHFRYVGKEAAQEIMEKGITFEEYLGVTSHQEDLS